VIDTPSNDAAPAAADTPARRPLLAVDQLVKYYPIHGGVLRRKLGDVKAVDDVTFDIAKGEVFGLVGESGCGKSTLGRTVIRLQPATSGSVTLDGEDVFAKKGADLKRFRRRMQIIFQDPVGSLNPRMPVSDIVGEGMLAQSDKENGWGTRSIRDGQVGDMLDAVGLRRDYARRYPHEFSGGQRQRIGIARALALRPDVVICDEPVSALDVSIQSQILNLLLDLRREFDLTYLFVAHNLSVIQYISDRVGVMYLGKIVEIADVDKLYSNPRHPYSIALLSAVPEPDPRVRKRRIVLTGDVPSPAAPPSGCRFHTRCWLREQLGRPEACEREVPVLRVLEPGHEVACHFAEQLTAEAATEAANIIPAMSAAVSDEVTAISSIAGFEATGAAAGSEEAAAAPAASVIDVSVGHADVGPVTSVRDVLEDIGPMDPKGPDAPRPPGAGTG
jgi:oligopeptide/dipeptide ABC transporter ATP-binding protein